MSNYSFEKKKLFNPGPVLSSQRIKKVLSHPDLCHRRPQFESVIDEVRKQLLKLYQVDDKYTSVIVSGSGTAANETTLSSIVREDERVLLVTNGEFGRRLEKILQIYDIPIEILEYKWGEHPKLEKVEEVLEEVEDIGLVAMTWHETSTGMINPVREIGKITKDYGKTFFVDGISAVGGEDIDLKRDYVDFTTGVANKCLGGLTGVSFVCFRDKAAEKRKSAPRRNEYLNLGEHLEFAEEKSQTPHTPSVTMIIALREALRELFDEGYNERISRYQECASIIREGVDEIGLNKLIPDDLASNTVTSVFLPEGKDLDTFIDTLGNNGYIVYPGKGHLRDNNMFQIANMGQIYPEDCHNFLDVLRKTIDDYNSL